MGCFSWCTSDTRKSIPCCIPFGDLPGTVYLLNPFGEPYKETDYEGYGVFGGRDVYDLVAEWNREYLTSENIRRPERGNWQPGEEGDAYYARAMQKYYGQCAAVAAYQAGASDAFMQENYGKILGYGDGSDWKRCLGIALACYDEDHVKLRYPIKIVEHPVPYDEAGISPGCPFQGCFYPDSMMAIRRGVRQAFESLDMAIAQSKSVSNLIEEATSKAQNENERESAVDQKTNVNFEKE